MDVAGEVVRLGQTTQGLVTSRQLAAAGTPRWALAKAARAGEVVRVRRAVYAVGPLPARPRFLVTGEGVAPQYVAHVRALLLCLGGAFVAAGRTAAVLYGWGLLAEPARTLEVAVAHGRGTVRLRGVRCRQRRKAQVRRVRVLAGTARLRMTSPVQTVVDCALALPLLQAVVVCDSALRSGRVAVDELAVASRRLRGTAAAAKVRRVVELCDPVCGSVLESVLRVRMALAGIEGFSTQEVLATVPSTIRVDFCHAQARLVVEVDGALWHQDPARDQARDNQLAVLGWRVLRFTWAQVVHEHETVLEAVRAALAATPTLHLAD